MNPCGLTWCTPEFPAWIFCPWAVVRLEVSSRVMPLYWLPCSTMVLYLAVCVLGKMVAEGMLMLPREAVRLTLVLDGMAEELVGLEAIGIGVEIGLAVVAKVDVTVPEIWPAQVATSCGAATIWTIDEVAGFPRMALG